MVYVWIIKVGKRWCLKWQRITETCVLLDDWLLLRIISEVTSEEEPSNMVWFTLPVKVPVNLIPLPVTTRKPGVVFLATFVAAVSGREQFHPEPSPLPGTPEEPFMMDKWEQILSPSFSLCCKILQAHLPQCNNWFCKDAFKNSCFSNVCGWCSVTVASWTSSGWFHFWWKIIKESQREREFNLAVID